MLKKKEKQRELSTNALISSSFRGRMKGGSWTLFCTGEFMIDKSSLLVEKFEFIFISQPHFFSSYNFRAIFLENSLFVLLWDFGVDILGKIDARMCEGIF